MKAKIITKQYPKKEDNMTFYKSLYSAMEKLKNLYTEQDGFQLKSIIENILKTRRFNAIERQNEMLELSSLQTLILATLIGLNKEKLEEANSNANTNLLQYKNHESELKIYTDENNFESAAESIKNYCNFLKFNPNKTGPFPYMLEIINSDGKERPYDCLSKIRNALLHAEYYLENDKILHIENHDENGNLTFEGRLLLYPFTIFVKDFFGNQAVSSSFSYFHMPLSYKFKNKDELEEFLKDIKRIEIKFTKIPKTETFKGQDSTYTRLNSCFDLSGQEQKDIEKELQTLKAEGYEYQETIHSFSETEIENIRNYVTSNYPNIYENATTGYKVVNLTKLMLNPSFEITNCLENILDYISTKKYFLESNKLITQRLKELTYDQYITEAFNYTLTILDANKISYALESDKIKVPNIKQIDTAEIEISDKTEFIRRVCLLMTENKDEETAKNTILLDTIRNSLAHGGERINVSANEDLEIELIDRYHHIPNLGLKSKLNSLKNILNSKIFSPESLKTKKHKHLTKKNN